MEKEDEFFDKIINILKKGAQERGAKEDIVITNTPSWKGIAIDMPKEHEKAYHGSVYEIICSESKLWCRIKGDLVTTPEKEEFAHRTLEKSDCRVFDIRHHKSREEEEISQSHIHFICKTKDKSDTINMINFLRDY